MVESDLNGPTFSSSGGIVKLNEAPVELVNVKSSLAVMLLIWEHGIPYAPNDPTGLMFGEMRAYKAFATDEGNTMFEVPGEMHL